MGEGVTIYFIREDATACCREFTAQGRAAVRPSAGPGRLQTMFRERYRFAGGNGSFRTGYQS